MITIKVTPARRRFGRTPRRQWRFEVIAGNNRQVDPRDTYANTGDIKQVWSKIVASDEPTVKLRMAEVELVEKEAAVKLLRAGRKERTGHEELDFDALKDGGDDE